MSKMAVMLKHRWAKSHVSMGTVYHFLPVITFYVLHLCLTETESGCRESDFWE